VDATLTDWLDRWARETPDGPAILTPAPITYAELQQKVRALAAGFMSLGLGKGDIVAAQLPNGVEFLLCYLAAASIGAALQTIHMPYRGAEIETLLAHSQAVAAVCVSRAKDSPAELILSLKAKLPHLRHVLAVGDEPPSGVLPFACIAATEPGAAHPRPTADDRFLLLYTSGTTAAPKGVPIVYRKFLTNALLSASELKIDAASILLSAAPFTHLYGLFSVNLALSVGATIAILPAFTPAALAATIDACRPTGLFVAPAHMAACLNMHVSMKACSPPNGSRRCISR
jgi:cyclohexanecarboxylate-CoA ligase